MSRPTSVSDHAKVAGMAVMPLVVMVVGVKVAWPDVTWGTILGGTIDGLLTALVALGIAIVYRANRDRELFGRRPGPDAGDPRPAALRLGRLEHLPRDRDRAARVDPAGRDRRVRVPAPVLPLPPAHPHSRHDRRHRSRSRAGAPATALARQQQRRAVPAVHQPALLDRPRTEQHQLLRQRRAHPDRRAPRAGRARPVLPLHVDRRRAARHGRERRPRLVARHPRAATPERGVGSRGVPRVRRDVPAHRRRRIAARPGARPHAPAHGVGCRRDRSNGEAADDRVLGDRSGHRLAVRPLPLLVGRVPVGDHRRDHRAGAALPQVHEPLPAHERGDLHLAGDPRGPPGPGRAARRDARSRRALDPRPRCSLRSSWRSPSCCPATGSSSSP